MVARAIKSELPEGARYFIVDPQGNGEVGVITKFRVGNSATYGGVMSALHKILKGTARTNDPARS